MGVIDCCGMYHTKPYGLPLDHTRGEGTVPLNSYFVKCDINPAKEMMQVWRIDRDWCVVGVMHLKECGVMTIFL